MFNKEQLGSLIVLTVLCALIIGSFTFFALNEEREQNMELRAFYNLGNVYVANGVNLSRGAVLSPQNGTYFPTTKTFCVYAKERSEEELIHTSLHEIGHAMDDRAGIFGVDKNRDEANANEYADSWNVVKK